jgi:hypothetical protein
MWPKHIILLTPLLELLLSVLHGQEPIDVQAFIPKRSVERLDHGIIHRTKWRSPEIYNQKNIFHKGNLAYDAKGGTASMRKASHVPDFESISHPAAATR